MPSALRVVSCGLGAIGLAAARLVLQKQSIQLVGAVDIDKAKVGKDLGELIGAGKPTGIKVERDTEAVLKRLAPDVLLHCTSSFLSAVKDDLLLAARLGIDVVSSTEELLVPDHRSPTLARELDAAAKAGGASILATGVNPGYAMDFMAVIASAVTFDVRSARCIRVVDAGTRRLSLLRKIGAGLGADEFQTNMATGRFGLVGMRESVALLARALDLEVDRVDQTVEPVIAVEDHKTPFLTVKEGRVSGLRNHSYGYVGKQTVLHLDLSMYVGAPDPRDEVLLESTPPIHLKFHGGIAGDQAAAAILVNNLHGVVAAAPGLRTVLDVQPPRLCR
ncbi:MAG: dihydrodipicolinate reductase [Planctomycetes bacterium]|nr:dihydrodipicolinate reductase [Planctomycetota bacterium]